MASVFEQVGNAIAPIFGGSTDTPKPGIAPLDPGTQGLINAGVTRAGQSGGQFADQINQGVSQNSASVGQDQQHASQEDQQFGGTQPMSDALRNAYSAQSGTNIGKLMKSNQYRGELAKSDYMNKMSQVAVAQQRVAAQNYATLTDAYNQSENSRAQFVNSLFQIGQQGMVMAAANHRKSGKSMAAGAGTPSTGGDTGFSSNYGDIGSIS